MKLLGISALILLTIVIIGLIRGWIITWGSFTDAELEDVVGVKIGRKGDPE